MKKSISSIGMSFRKIGAAILSLALVLSLIPSLAFGVESNTPEIAGGGGPSEQILESANPQTPSADDSATQEQGVETSDSVQAVQSAQATQVTTPDPDTPVAKGRSVTPNVNDEPIIGEGFSFAPDTGELTITSNEGTTNWRLSINDKGLVISVIIESPVDTLGTDAFYGCTSLTSITLPEGITSIGECAFSRCEKLKEIIFEGSVAPTVDSYSFSNISSSGVVIYPEGATGYDQDVFRNKFPLDNWIFMSIPDNKGKNAKYSIYANNFIMTVDESTQSSNATILGASSAIAINKTEGSFQTSNIAISYPLGYDASIPGIYTLTFSIGEDEDKLEIEVKQRIIGETDFEVEDDDYIIGANNFTVPVTEARTASDRDIIWLAGAYARVKSGGQPSAIKVTYPESYDKESVQVGDIYTIRFAVQARESLYVDVNMLVTGDLEDTEDTEGNLAENEKDPELSNSDKPKTGDSLTQEPSAENPLDISLLSQGQSIVVSDKAWSGKQIKSGLKINVSYKVNEQAITKTLTQNKDYTITTVGANKNIGKGTVVINGTGVFAGTKALSFNIVPKTPAKFKVKAAKKSLKINFKKVSKAQKVKTYKVEYRAKGQLKWKSKTIKVKLTKKANKKKKVSLTLKKLKSKKKYQVRVYAYKGAYKGAPTKAKQKKVK